MAPFLLAIFAIPFATVPILLIFSLRDWLKDRRSLNGFRPSVFGLVAILSVACEWLLPPIIYAVLGLTGIGIDYSKPVALGAFLVWSFSIAISTAACLLSLRGAPRTQAGIAALVLLLTSLFVIRFLTFPWDF